MDFYKDSEWKIPYLPLSLSLRLIHWCKKIAFLTVFFTVLFVASHISYANFYCLKKSKPKPKSHAASKSRQKVDEAKFYKAGFDDQNSFGKS